MPDPGTYAGEAPGVAALERLARASGAKEAERSGLRWDSGDLDREQTWVGWAEQGRRGVGRGGYACRPGLLVARPAALAGGGPGRGRAGAPTPRADLELVLLFAFAHDTRRWHDGHNPDHGRRAAAAMRQLAEVGVLDLEPARLGLLCRACAGHADGLTSPEPTVGVCWDADRLNLWRVGLTPARSMLSTAAARSAEVHDWSRGVHAGSGGGCCGSAI